MQSYHIKNGVNLLLTWLVNCLLFLRNIFKRNLFVLDSITYRDSNYYAQFFYIAKRQFFTKTVQELFMDKSLLKNFCSADVALISYLCTRANYEKMYKQNSKI